MIHTSAVHVKPDPLTTSLSSRQCWTGTAIFGVAALVFVGIGVPVVLRGAPLADDFVNCMSPVDLGLTGFMSASWERLGTIRLVRFVEILLTTGVCRTLPFGAAIAVPLTLTVLVGFLIRGVLRDLGTPGAWADVGGALWLLQPLGTEAGLWPAALHVPLGLGFALGALRLYHRGRTVWATAATACALMSLEQVILVMPVAAWIVSPPATRRRATASATAVGIVALGVFATWNGNDVRLNAGIVERLGALTEDPFFYVGFPAVGLGLHSIPLAIQWAWPWSVAVLAGGATAGVLALRRLPLAPTTERRTIVWTIAAAVLLILLANVLVVANLPRQGSPRVFTPTWAILVIAVAAIASRIRWRRPALVGGLGGAFAAGAVLSLALSSAVRLASADFVERSAHVLAARTSDGADVAVCGVKRTVLPIAPRGAFAVHELIYPWGAELALRYYTGRRATFHLAGEPWEGPCPRDADVVVDFDELLAAAGQG